MPTPVVAAGASRRRPTAGVLLFAVFACDMLLRVGLAVAQPPVSTTIVGLQIQGGKVYERTVATDFDMLQPDDTTRLIPLLHLLDLLGVPTTETGDTLQFVSGKGEHFGIIISQRTVSKAGQTARPLEMVYGVSDLTGERDVFVAISEVDSLLNIKLKWREENYALEGSSTSVYPAWKLASSGGGADKKSLDKLPEIGADLPLVEPSGPSQLGDPRLHMLQPGIRATQSNNDDLRLQKTLSGWGRLAGGRYEARLRQQANELSSALTMDRVSLTHRLGDLETSLGDVQFGLSDLVYPASSAMGVSVTGLLGLTERERQDDRSDFGRQEVFPTRETVRGQALLGSKVELYVNDRYAGEQVATEQRWARTGYGAYEFLDVRSTRDRQTDFRVVITEPDGTVKERYRDAVGTTALLRRGQTLINAVGGQRRLTTGEFWNTQGAVYGGRLLYGITPFWTLGLTGGYQDRHAYLFDLDQAATTSRSGLAPRESEHEGVESRIRFFKRDLLQVSVAQTRGRYDSNYESRSAGDTTVVPWIPFSSVPWGERQLALRASFDAYFGQWLKLRPLVFHYDSSYFDGSNTDVADRRGYALTTRFQISRGMRVTLTHGELWDNAGEQADTTTRQWWSHADFPLPVLVRGTALRFSGDRLETRTELKPWLGVRDTNLKPRYLARLDLMSTSLRIVELSAAASLGEELQKRDETDLMRGFNLPNSVSSNRPGWNAQASRKLLKNGQISLNHTKSEFRERSQLSHILRASDTSHLTWRYDVGYDWQSEEWFTQLQPEWYFDRTGTSRITGIARNLTGEWVFSLGLKFEPILSFVGGAPFLIPNSKLNPTSGGIKGRVYLDQNGNGLRDHREPGVPGVEVVTDGGRRAVSGKHGEFLLSGMSSKRKLRVVLDPKKLPVDYTAAGGQQWVDVEPGSISPSRLAVTKLGSISGTLLGKDPSDTTRMTGVAGVRVIAKDTLGALKQESITYDDGTFYLGELRPGKYILDVDRATIGLPVYRGGFPVGPVTVVDDGEQGLDVAGVEMYLMYVGLPPPESAPQK
ncbi:hypothetical protein HZB60_12700 [candidate division KSB1 bacterium]|nr:hypothetical protein [candidate division KSB1 bacterium]